MTHPLTSHLHTRKKLIAQRFSLAQSYDTHAFIQQAICQRLVELLLTTQHASVLEVGAGSGQLTTLLAQTLQSERWLINELCQTHAATLQAIVPAARIHIGDAERSTYNDITGLGDNHSLVVSANAIQWFDSPLAFITQAAEQLQRGGQLLFSTFTPEHFYEFKNLTGQGLHYPSSEQWRAQLKQSGFTVHYYDTYRRTLNFATPYAVLRHLKATGVTAIPASSKDKPETLSPPPFWNKQRLADFEQQYRKQFATTDGQVTLTYDALIVSAQLF